MATALKKGARTAQELILSARASCHRRREKVSVRSPLVLIRKVTERLTFDRWQIMGEPFRKTSLLGTDFWEEVKIMRRKGTGKSPCSDSALVLIVGKGFWEQGL